jgi:hypothetical protein
MEYEKVGNPLAEASAWIQLGSIDLREGDYRCARDKSIKGLKITQLIGD